MQFVGWFICLTIEKYLQAMGFQRVDKEVLVGPTLSVGGSYETSSVRLKVTFSDFCEKMCWPKNGPLGLKVAQNEVLGHFLLQKNH